MAGFLVGHLSGYNVARCSKLGHEIAIKVIQNSGPDSMLSHEQEVHSKGVEIVSGSEYSFC